MRQRNIVVNSLRVRGGAQALTGAITLNEQDHAYHTLVLNNATGFTVTLPAATGSGAIYKFVVGTTVTSGSLIIQCGNTTDEFHGLLMLCDTDTTDTLTAEVALDGDGFDTITMDGSTAGGIMGDSFEIIDYAAGKFALISEVNITGDVGTVISAA